MKKKQAEERQKIEKEWGEMEEIDHSLNVNQTDQLEALRFKLNTRKQKLPRERSEQILENEMPGMRKEIPKEETQNKYGHAARKIEIVAVGKHGTFIRVSFVEIPDGASLIEGGICIRNQNNPIAAGRAESGAYMDEKRKLDA